MKFVWQVRIESSFSKQCTSYPILPYAFERCTLLAILRMYVSVLVFGLAICRGHRCAVLSCWRASDSETALCQKDDSFLVKTEQKQGLMLSRSMMAHRGKPGSVKGSPPPLVWLVLPDSEGKLAATASDAGAFVRIHLTRSR